MCLDPCADVGLVGIPQRRLGGGQVGEVEAEGGLRSHADMRARDMAKKHRARRLARPCDAHRNSFRAEPGPSQVILRDAAAVIVGDAYRLGRGGRTCAAKGKRGDHEGHAFADRQAASFAALAHLARRVHAGDITLDDAIAAHPFEERPADEARPAFDRALAQLAGLEPVGR